MARNRPNVGASIIALNRASPVWRNNGLSDMITGKINETQHIRFSDVNKRNSLNRKAFIAFAIDHVLVWYAVMRHLT